ncbi:MAG: phosphoribosylglycinamide formyltransferase [Lachnospiraceae bacterium]|jgi:phosphoribosylglycinamide formyltransferase-1|nr:phosphoribosylglycinamide formyltransferase [Lachnospiraceae bacterium]
MLRVVVLISGGGTNLQAIIDAIATEKITDTKIVGVISNNPKAKGLERAQAAQIATRVISPKQYVNRQAFEEGLLVGVEHFDPDLIVLAGFMVKISAAMITRYEGRIINIHPSLIPSFCGLGMYGIHVHEKVLERGVKVTGATVHFVTQGLDEGPIISQKAVSVLPTDTPETLQRRVMEEAEWNLLPQAIEDFAHGRIQS